MAPRRGGRRGERGSALLMALFLVLALAVVAAALVRFAGDDRIDAARLGVKERGLLCAEAGLQYGRRFFGTRYETTHGWNDYLNGTLSGYRYDPQLGDTVPSSLSGLPMQVRGASNGTSLDSGADLGTGGPAFWVSIRDDDDELPLGVPDNRRRDNNETVILRSECTVPSWAVRHGGNLTSVVLEARLTHIQGASGYGNAQITTNSPDIVGLPGGGP